MASWHHWQQSEVNILEMLFYEWLLFFFYYYFFLSQLSKFWGWCVCLLHVPELWYAIYKVITHHIIKTNESFRSSTLLKQKKWQKICNIIWYDIKQSIPFKISLQPTNQTNNTHLKPKSFWFTVLDLVIEYEFNVGIFIETSIHLFTEYVSA